MIEPDTFLFPESEWVPNHRVLPVLFYRQALPPQQDRAGAFEAAFEKAGWKGVWRNGIFNYQHYHTGAHEVLGIARGEGLVLIGGPDGARLAVEAGDCLVLPAGTGHMRLAASDDFLVIGGYPPGQHADIQTGAPSLDGRERLRNLALPDTDPLYGQRGPLTKLWRNAAEAAA